MVLWEITMGTAYFLGLKRTYRLALKIQRRLICPKIRQFLQRYALANLSLLLFHFQFLVLFFDGFRATVITFELPCLGIAFFISD